MTSVERQIIEIQDSMKRIREDISYVGGWIDRVNKGNEHLPPTHLCDRILKTKEQRALVLDGFKKALELQYNTAVDNLDKLDARLVMLLEVEK